MRFQVFGLNASRNYAAQVVKWIATITDSSFELSTHEEGSHEDGEPYLRATVNVRGSDVYVIQSLYEDQEESVQDKFVKLCFFGSSLRDASADRITAVIPYMSYSRQDRKVKSREPVYTKYMATILEESGFDRILTLDPHNLAASQNAFHKPADYLEAKNLIADWIIDNKPDGSLCFLSPDSGGVGRTKRCLQAVANRLGIKTAEIDLAFFDKSRINGHAEGNQIIGNVKDKKVIVIDDIIASGSTISLCQQAIAEAGGELWAACCSHGLFVGNANEHLATVPNIVTTDTVSPFRLDEENIKRVSIISTAKLFAQAIRRTHVSASISALFN